MYAHSTLVLLPLTVAVFSLIATIQASVICHFQKTKNTFAIKLSKFIGNILWIVAFIIGVFTFRIEYCFIPAPLIGLAIFIDMVLISYIATVISVKFITPDLDLAEESKENDVKLLVWLIAISIFTIQLFFSIACVFQWDWAFRPIVGQDTLDWIAEQREIDVIQREVNDNVH